MTRSLIRALAVLALLAACGADGAPTPPPAQSGVTISGQVKAGIGGGS